MHQSHQLFGCHATGTLFFAYLFLTCLALFTFIMSSHKSNINNSFRIIFIKVTITKVNTIKAYSIKTHIITKNYGIIRIFINKDYIILDNTTSSSFSSILFVTNQSRTNLMLVEKHQQLYHTFPESYVYRGNFLA